MWHNLMTWHVFIGPTVTYDSHRGAINSNLFDVYRQNGANPKAIIVNKIKIAQNFEKSNFSNFNQKINMSLYNYMCNQRHFLLLIRLIIF